MHKTQISYSAPVCATLTGDINARYGKPSLMIALRKRVIAAVSDKPSDNSGLRDIVNIVGEITSVRSVNVDVTAPDSLSQRSVQSAVLCAVIGCLLASKDPNLELQKALIQKLAYKAEKNLFGQYSHAQTVASIQGGILFFRKEFEFYRTVMTIPAKLPKTHEEIFSQVLGNTVKPASVISSYSSEKSIKRLVFSIMSEDADMFEKTLQSVVQHDSTDIPRLKAYLPDHEGLKRIA